MVSKGVFSIRGMGLLVNLGDGWLLCSSNMKTRQSRGCGEDLLGSNQIYPEMVGFLQQWKCPKMEIVNCDSENDHEPWSLQVLGHPSFLDTFLDKTLVDMVGFKTGNQQQLLYHFGVYRYTAHDNPAHFWIYPILSQWISSNLQQQSYMRQTKNGPWK